MFRPHRAIFREHILMEPTALCSLMSIVLVEVGHYSQFRRFENVSLFPIFVLRLLCAPLSLPLAWSYVLCINLVFRVLALQPEEKLHE
jgi:hypothetical protein